MKILSSESLTGMELKFSEEILKTDIRGTEELAGDMYPPQLIGISSAGQNMVPRSV